MQMVGSPRQLAEVTGELPEDVSFQPNEGITNVCPNLMLLYVAENGKSGNNMKQSESLPGWLFSQTSQPVLQMTSLIENIKAPHSDNAKLAKLTPSGTRN